jgi:hypothetical protein
MKSSNPELVNVRASVGQAIQLFYDNRMAGSMPMFHADDLRVFVEAATGKTAPASADRILRDMRQSGKINYEVTNRSKSLYRLLPKISTKGKEGTDPVYINEGNINHGFTTSDTNYVVYTAVVA